MKNIIVTSCLLILAVYQSTAQTLEEGKKMYTYERFSSADRIFNQVAMANPSLPDAWYWLVKNCIAEDSLDKAKKYDAAIPASLSKEPYILVAKGSLLLYTGESVAAKQYFEEALGSKKKKDPFVQLAIAQAYNEVKNSNHAQAVELLLAANKGEKSNAEILTTLGDAYRWLLDGSAAYRAYQEAIDANDHYADALFKMGKIFQTQHNADMYLNYYQRALSADSNYTPAYYELFYYYYNKNEAAQAFNWVEKYLAHTDPNINNEYLLADMLLVNKRYPEAIAQAKKILVMDHHAKPTVYRLLAYASKGINDLAKSEQYLNSYFIKQPDSNQIASDYDLLGYIYEKTNRDSLAMDTYTSAFCLQKDTLLKLQYATKLAAHYKQKKEYEQEAIWDGQIVSLKQNPNNLDLYNWGIASFNSGNYEMSDSVFAMYEEKYPKQTYGYYWRARSNAAIDTAMQSGIAVPHYLKLIDVAATDTANSTNKRWLIQAYGYVASFKANNEKDYPAAIDYFDKVLELAPDNEQVLKYKAILEKRIKTD